MKKIISLLLALMVVLTMCMSFAGCTEMSSGTEKDISATVVNANKLQVNQPTPTDIDYSLERYNLIRRAYWVNGQREKANTLPCEIEKPLGYIVLFSGNTIVGNFIVDGKVSSLNSYLTPDSEAYEIEGESADSTLYHNGSTDNDWLADVDGSYGSNDNGIFFFTPDGKYIEWTGSYLFSDIPFEIKNPSITIKAGE